MTARLFREAAVQFDDSGWGCTMCAASSAEPSGQASAAAERGVGARACSGCDVIVGGVVSVFAHGRVSECVWLALVCMCGCQPACVR
jgi:hypothetical protein